MRNAPVLHRSYSEPLSLFGEDRHPTAGRYVVVGLHGFGIVRGKAVATVEDLVWALRNTCEAPDSLATSMRGSLTLYLEDLFTGSFIILTDPFGAGLVFEYRHADHWAISSSLPDLISFAVSRGLPTTKSALHVGIMAINSRQSLGVAPYEEVTILPAFTWVEAAGERTDYHEYAFIDQWLLPEAGEGLNSLLDANAEEIAENVAAYSDYDAPSRIVQLTGGMDSRTVLAALISRGRQRDFQTFTSGRDEEPDVSIAARLAGTYGMTRTSFPGFRSSLAPYNGAELKVWGYHETAGMIGAGARVGLERRRDSVVLAGGWGEFYRGGYLVPFNDEWNREQRITYLVNVILGSGSPYARGNEGGLYEDSVIEVARLRAEEVIDSGEKRGIPSEALTQWAYLLISNRIFVGEITRSWSPYCLRADPLYTPHLIPLSVAASREMREAGTLQLDLQHRLSPGINCYPFAYGKDLSNYYSERGISAKDFGVLVADPPAERWDRWIDSGVLLGGTKAEKPTQEQVQQAIALQMPVRFVVEAEAHREALRTFVRSGATDALEGVFRREAVRQLAERPPRRRPQYRRIEELVSVLNWFVS